MNTRAYLAEIKNVAPYYYINQNPNFKNSSTIINPTHLTTARRRKPKMKNRAIFPRKIRNEAQFSLKKNRATAFDLPPTPTEQPSTKLHCKSAGDLMDRERNNE